MREASLIFSYNSFNHSRCRHRCEVPLAAPALTQGGEAPLGSAGTCPAVAMRHVSCSHGLLPCVCWPGSPCHHIFQEGQANNSIGQELF